MKLFKSVDEKLEEIGFIKKREDKYGAEKERILILNMYKNFLFTTNKTENI